MQRNTAGKAGKEGQPMKRVATVLMIAMVLLPGVARAGSSTDATLGLGAFAVFNQILSGTGVFGAFGRPVAAPQPVYVQRPVVIEQPVVIQQSVVVAPPVPVYAPPVYAPAPPVYVVPAPVVVSPRPVYFAPPVVVYSTPAPVYYPHYVRYEHRWHGRHHDD